MFISDYTLSLLFEINEIFGSDEFLESGSDYMIVSNFSSICYFFSETRLLKNRTVFHLANYIFSSAVSTFLATLSSNFF